MVEEYTQRIELHLGQLNGLGLDDNLVNLLGKLPNFLIEKLQMGTHRVFLSFIGETLEGDEIVYALPHSCYKVSDNIKHPPESKKVVFLLAGYNLPRELIERIAREFQVSILECYADYEPSIEVKAPILSKSLYE